MTSLLILVIVALLGIAIWQLTKIFDLTQNISGNELCDSEIATDKDNNIQGYLLFGFLGFIYALTIFSIVKYGHFPLLANSASEHGKDVDNLMWISLGLIFFVQTITQFLLHYFAFANRGRKDKKAFYFSDNEKLEMIWTIIPVIVLSGLILYGLFTWNAIMNVDEEEDVIYVEVYAKQFGWDIRYAGKDNVLGKANVRFIKGVNVTGADMSDPNSQDDILATELRLPKGKKVVMKMRSQDVLHSAYFPHFRAQMNCVPGMVTQFAMTPSVTTAEIRETEEIKNRVSRINKVRSERSAELVAKGEEALAPYVFDYVLLCNKICGRSHYNMQLKVVVETEAEFNKWFAAQKTLGQLVADEKAAAEAPAVEKVVAPEQNTQELETVVDTTAVVAQVIK
ncbi:cytochrome c oxidase subunit II [Flavobacterium sp. I3-2]|uniref:cytochrome c oxidase subunit II n=1 Tax=Flavobacterium sp. I3-2 TaxID=2748319 RepID=UPI0015AF6C5C|nr:cytochrome c oxidase subunit II [Flavobacterium sp. I3-2]